MKRAPRPLAIRLRSSGRVVDPARLDAALHELTRAIVTHILATERNGQNPAAAVNESALISDN